MTKTFGNIDLTNVIHASYSVAEDLESEEYENEVKAYIAFYGQMAKENKKRASQLEGIHQAIVYHVGSHYHSVGFMDGVRYAAYIMSMADSLKSIPVISAGLQLAETAAAEVDN